MAFRLKQKHSENLDKAGRPVDGQALIDAQSLLHAFLAALIVILLLNMFWAYSAHFLNRVFPWFVLVQAAFVGLAVRRWGRGFDWRFPALAAVMAFLGSYTGNFLLAADTTAGEFGTNPIFVITRMSEYTLKVFFEEVVTPVDHIYALYAAGISAYFASRQLTRGQEFAVRTAGKKDNNE